MLIQYFQMFQKSGFFHFSRSLPYCLWLLFIFSPAALATTTILVLGDSLSAAHNMPVNDGWVSLLQEKVESDYPDVKIVNASIAGDTTANGLQRLPALLQEHHPKIVILELGGNDALRGTPILAIRVNLEALIKMAQAADAKVILAGMKIPPNYGETYTNQFAELYPALSKKYDLPLIPFLLEGIALNPQLMFEDKIHPRPEAQPIILDNVWPYLLPLLAKN